MNIYYASSLADDARRAELYAGSLFVLPSSAAAQRLCGLARSLVEEAFAPHDPLRIHEHISAEQCATILGELKPRFIHHPEAKAAIQAMLIEAGCDPEKTYFDVPRLRTAFPGDYLKSGIAYAFHPHRDTWYSAPLCQINWWMPVYEINRENCMAVHPHYFGRAVKNSSSVYNYQRWNQESRFNAAQHVKVDTRVQPHAEEPIELQPEVRLVCEPAQPYLFSAAHLHSTVPNTSPVTRYSIDFRVVHLDEVRAHSGAANVDSACTGTTMMDYLRVSDLEHLPEELVAEYLEAEALLS